MVPSHKQFLDKLLFKPKVYPDSPGASAGFLGNGTQWGKSSWHFLDYASTVKNMTPEREGLSSV